MGLGYERTTTPHATCSPTTRDLEWAAGFIEGEGCITNSRGPNHKGCEHVSAAQVNPEPLWRLQELFGGAITKRQGATTDSKAYWLWQASGSRARGIMLTLYTLLSTIKQAQVLEALRTI